MLHTEGFLGKHEQLYICSLVCYLGHNRVENTENIQKRSWKKYWKSQGILSPEKSEKPALSQKKITITGRCG